MSGPNCRPTSSVFNRDRRNGGLTGLFFKTRNRLLVAQPAIRNHDETPEEVVDEKRAFSFLPGISNCLVATEERQAVDSKNEQDHPDPKEGVVIPNWRLGGLFLTHGVRVYLPTGL